MFGRSAEYKAKCRAIFINSIYILLDNRYPYDDSFKEMINNFIDSYSYEMRTLFELMYDFKYEDDTYKCIGSNDNIEKEFIKYMNGNLNEVYNSVKESDVELISKAAELFYDYINYMALLRYDGGMRIKH